MTAEAAREPSWRRPFAPIDPASLGWFRFALGALLVWEGSRFLSHGWVTEYFVDPSFHFKYFGFEWVQPLGAEGMRLLFQALMGCAALLTLGIAPRTMSALLCTGWCYVFLCEQARYLNHIYLLVLLLFMLAWIPSGNDFGLAQLRGKPRRKIPALGLLALRSQMGVVYFFGGIAKINYDWLDGVPLDSWLSNRSDLLLIGPLLDLPLSGLTFAWAGLAIDLFAWPFLEHRIARYMMFALLAAFHVTNFFLFHIGIFPWMALAITTLWLPPDWPRRLTRRVTDAADAIAPRGRRVALSLAGLWFVWQFAMPLRHHLYPGNVAWNEQGHRFSWRMKLRSKRGEATFRVSLPSIREHRLVDSLHELTSWQARKMATRPDMLLQYAHHLADDARAEGHADVQVRAISEVSLNRREPELIVDPNVDLAQVQDGLAHQTWITDGPSLGPRH